MCSTLPNAHTERPQQVRQRDPQNCRGRRFAILGHLQPGQAADHEVALFFPGEGRARESKNKRDGYQ
jgi:hypothetical protein